MDKELTELLEEIREKMAVVLPLAQRASNILRCNPLPHGVVLEANTILPTLVSVGRDATMSLPRVTRRIQQLIDQREAPLLVSTQSV